MSAPGAFDFTAPPLVRFGAGTLAQLGALAAAHGCRAWLVTGAGALERSGAIERALASLAEAGVSVARQRVSGEPDTRTVDDGARAAAAAGCDLVIGLGGGSALDTAKAVAGLAANGGEALDYLEVIGRGRALATPALPVIAVPTTAGTGSEATRNAVVADAASGVKASIRHESLLPRVALLDPELGRGLPADVTARTGLDALAQLIEPFVSRRDHPLIDALAPAALARAAAALPRAWAADDPDARAEMLWAAFASGLALAHCGLGACHALAGPLGGAFPVPHGTACAATLAPVMRANLAAAARDARGAETVRRYAIVACALGEPARANERATADAGVERVASLVAALGVPGLAAFGVTLAAVPELVARARRTSSMKANPVELTEDELAAALTAALG